MKENLSTLSQVILPKLLNTFCMNLEISANHLPNLKQLQTLWQILPMCNNRWVEFVDVSAAMSINSHKNHLQIYKLSWICQWIDPFRWSIIPCWHIPSYSSLWLCVSQLVQTELWIICVWLWIIDNWGNSLASPNFINFMRIQRHLQFSQIANVSTFALRGIKYEGKYNTRPHPIFSRRFMPLVRRRHSEPFDRKWQVSKIGSLTFGAGVFSTHFPYHLPQSQLTWQSEQIHNVCPACALVPLPNHPWSHSVANVIRVIALSFVGLGGPCCLFCLSPAFAYIKKSIHFDSVRSNKNWTLGRRFPTGFPLFPLKEQRLFEAIWLGHVYDFD